MRVKSWKWFEIYILFTYRLYLKTLSTDNIWKLYIILLLYTNSTWLVFIKVLLLIVSLRHLFLFDLEEQIWFLLFPGKRKKIRNLVCLIKIFFWKFCVFGSNITVMTIFLFFVCFGNIACVSENLLRISVSRHGYW